MYIPAPTLFKPLTRILSLISLNLQDKPKKEGPLSLEEAIDDSENLTDFLMDFEQDEWLLLGLQNNEVSQLIWLKLTCGEIIETQNTVHC